MPLVGGEDYQNTPGYSVHYGYDVNGLQTYARFGSPSGPGVANAYDGFGRPVSSTTATPTGLWLANSYSYNAAGNRTRLETNSGYQLYFTYDAAGRMQTVQEAGPNVVAQSALLMYPTLRAGDRVCYSLPFVPKNGKRQLTLTKCTLVR